MTFDQREFRQALGRFASGVTIISVTHDGVERGMTCSSFMSVSLQPPLVLASVMNSARTLPLIRASGRYGVSILGEHQAHVSNHFASRASEDILEPFVYVDGMPLVRDAAVHLVTTVVDTHVAGDHTLLIGEVTYLEYQADAQPLLYFTGKYGQWSPTTS